MKPPSRLRSGSSSASAAARSSAAFGVELRQSAASRGQFVGQVRPRCQDHGELAHREEAVAQAGEVARAAALEPEARQRPREVGRALQHPAQPVAQVAVVGEERDRIVPRPDGVDLGERPGQALRQKPRPARGHGPVDGGERRFPPARRKACGSVRDWRASPRRWTSAAPGAVAARRVAGPAGCRAASSPRRTERRARRRDLGAAEGAERVERRDAEMILEPPLRGGRVEALAGEGRHGGAGLAPQARKSRILEDCIRQEDLARFEPRDLGGEPGPSVSLKEKRPVEMSRAASP